MPFRSTPTFTISNILPFQFSTEPFENQTVVIIPSCSYGPALQ